MAAPKSPSEAKSACCISSRPNPLSYNHPDRNFDPLLYYPFEDPPVDEPLSGSLSFEIDVAAILGMRVPLIGRKASRIKEREFRCLKSSAKRVKVDLDEIPWFEMCSWQWTWPPMNNLKGWIIEALWEILINIQYRGWMRMILIYVIRMLPSFILPFSS